MKWNKSKVHLISYAASFVLLVAILVKIASFYQDEKRRLLSVPVLQDENDIVFGDSNAELTLFMFGNYQCSHCLHFLRETMPELLQKEFQGKRLKVVFKFVVFSNKKEILDVYKTALCIYKYGEYTKFHELLLYDFGLSGTEEYDQLTNYIFQHNEAIANCMYSHSFNEYLDQNKLILKDVNQTGTPIFVIGNRLIRGNMAIEKFESILNNIIK